MNIAIIIIIVCGLILDGLFAILIEKILLLKCKKEDRLGFIAFLLGFFFSILGWIIVALYAFKTNFNAIVQDIKLFKIENTNQHQKTKEEIVETKHVLAENQQAIADQIENIIS